MELFRALGVLVEPPTPEQRELAELLELPAPPGADVYSDIFLFQLYPYASVYLGREGMLGGEARDRIAGFWRALDLEPPTEPDHLSVLLAGYARLAELSAEAPDERSRDAWERARRAFFHEHLASWLPLWLVKLDELAPPYYRSWGDLLGRALATEAAALGPAERPALALREAPGLPDPAEEGAEAFLSGLLAPVRSGMILVRADLERAGRDLGLGVRAGERRYVLESLLGQDAAATLGWLAGEARRERDLPADVATRFWRRQAADGAALLDRLAREAR